MPKVTKSDETRIVQALKENDIPSLRSLLEDGYHPGRTIRGENPITYCRTAEAIDLLLRFGAEINLGEQNWTPLLSNVDQGNENSVAFLIARKADVNRPYSGRGESNIPFGTTPLMRAAERGFVSLVRLLICSGANPDLLDEFGHNALFRALRSNQPRAAEELIGTGCSLTADILCGPVKHGNLLWVERLAGRDGVDANAVFCRFDGDKHWPEGETLLGYAIRQVGVLNYPAEIIKVLIKAGADVNKPSHWFSSDPKAGKARLTTGSVSPLRIAGSRGLIPVMKLLWEAGAHGSAVEALADWSLERAVCRGHTEVAKLLIEAGIDPNARGVETKKRPIELAREVANGEILEALKRVGAK